MEQAQVDRAQASLYALREDLRHQLVERGANPDEDSLEGVDFDFGFADSAQSTAERDRVLAEVSQLRHQLAEVDRALRKVDEGTYGTCERCGQPISPERLDALPYSTQCVSCKQKSA